METDISQRKNQGFTLIETCIALVLLMILLSGIPLLCVYAIKYTSTAAIRAGALSVAQRKLEQLRATPFTSCTSSSDVVTIGPTTGSQTYMIDITVTDVTPTMKNIKIVVTPSGRSTGGAVYAGNEGWKYGQVIVYTKRTSLGAGVNLG
jgi:Tfp pilus assembly protein PilV